MGLACIFSLVPGVRRNAFLPTAGCMLYEVANEAPMQALKFTSISVISTEHEESDYSLIALLVRELASHI